MSTHVCQSRENETEKERNIRLGRFRENGIRIRKEQSEEDGNVR